MKIFYDGYLEASFRNGALSGHKKMTHILPYGPDYVPICKAVRSGSSSPRFRLERINPVRVLPAHSSRNSLGGSHQVPLLDVASSFLVKAAPIIERDNHTNA